MLNPVALIRLDSRSRSTAIESPEIERSCRALPLLFDGLSDKVKDLQRRPSIVKGRSGTSGVVTGMLRAAPLPLRASSRMGRAEPESGPRRVASSAKRRGAATRPALSPH